ncbi:MAG TPA: glycerol-3-phosphate 1-O-acyltransferase PlsY [Gemmatimonadales bacterium]|nr:glycerol-3-phosphate 1-O-acyltransferase PlsY [Gemmatimonadales bacterium]
MTIRLVVAVLAAYLIGAIPTSFVVVRLARGIDLRTTGSGNLGVTNLYRLLGWKYAAPVAAFDTLKGAAPVALLAPWAGVGLFGAVGLGVMAVVGHVFSMFVGFKGGKGVATGGGVILAVAPWAFLLSLSIWALVVKLSGYVSLGSIAAALSLPPAVWLLHPDRRSMVLPVAALALLVVWFHRANIRRLQDGTENRFGRKAA